MSLNRYFDEAIAKRSRCTACAMSRQLDHRRHARRHRTSPRPRWKRRIGREAAMSGRASPRVLSIPPGAAFLPTLAERRCSAAAWSPASAIDGDPLAAGRRHGLRADAARCARAALDLRRCRPAAARRSCLVSSRSASSTRTRRPSRPKALERRSDLAPPVAATDRLLHARPLGACCGSAVCRQRSRRCFEEEIVVPASAADAIWLARDLAGADGRDRDRGLRLVATCRPGDR
jgi:hypothetical protein